MPVIARFFGITIKMYLRQKEHNPPHIHAIYGDYSGLFSIESGEMYEGDIPSKEQKLKCTLCQGHYDFSFSGFYFIFVCCVEASK